MCHDQAEMYSNQQQKAEFLQSVMGKGILLLSLSMIKYSWYTVMKQVLSTILCSLHIDIAQNCERLDRIAASTSKVKMLAAGCKAFVREDSDEDIGGEEAREEE